MPNAVDYREVLLPIAMENIGVMQSRDELQRKLLDAGLSHVADPIVQLSRPCYRVERTLTPEDRIPIGASKFGGSPDVPAGFEWPQLEGTRTLEAMEFVAQIRLGDLPEPLPEPVPPDGLLSFFARWSDGRVFFFAEGTSLQRTVGPQSPPPPVPTSFSQRLMARLKRKPEVRQTYRACTLRFAHQISPPDGSSSMVKQLKLSNADSEAYFNHCLETSGGATPLPEHQMFGHAQPVQNEMELECDFLRRGQQIRWDLPQEHFIRAARDWVLLLQVDTDDYKEGPGWMWGDAGMLYFWIHREDLGARTFDKTIAIEQCH